MTVTAFGIVFRAARHFNQARLDIRSRFVIFDGVRLFHADFAIKHCSRLFFREILDDAAILVAAIVEECGEHALVLDSRLFRFQAAHRMPGTTDLRQFELLVERVIGILVLVFEPVNRLGRLASIARRNAQGNHDKTMRSEPADHAFVSARFRAAARPPHNNAVFLVARKLFRIS